MSAASMIPILRRVRADAVAFVHESRGLVVALVVIQAIVFGPFFTWLVITNHTFPNTLITPYPSYRTQFEGRWLADLVIWLQGGSGVQPLLMVAAATVQATSGLLFARLVGLRERTPTLLVATVLCVYPAFLDYYSFASDHLVLTLGDLFVVLGALAWSRLDAPVGFRVVFAALAFVCALALYPPKLGLIGVIVIAAILVAVYERTDGAPPRSSRAFVVDAGLLALTVTLACGLYFASTRFTMRATDGLRGRINTLGEMASIALGSYRRVVAGYGEIVDWLPSLFRILPVVVCALGIVLVVRRTGSARVAAIGIAAALLLPPALRAAYIVNHETWENCARIATPYAYVLVLFLALMLRDRIAARLAYPIAFALLYAAVIVGAQESNAAAARSGYELALLNRVAARIEALPLVAGRQYRLLVFGHLPPFSREQAVRYPNTANRANALRTAFEDYRQPELLGFVLGRELRRPRLFEMTRAMVTERGRAPWPSADSVFLKDDLIVVLLERVGPGVVHTVCEDDFTRR